MRVILAEASVIFLILANSVVAQSSFSCSFGEPACLDYGAVVCKSAAKCVAHDAICFDSYTCDYNGFVCKSTLNKASDEYDSLLIKYNNIVSDYNTNLEELRKKQGEIEELNSTISDVESERDTALDKIKKINDCLFSSSTFDEAKLCK